VPGTRTIYYRRWRLAPSCLGARCARIRLRMQRSDGRYDAVTLRRSAGVYRARLRTRAVCRGRLARRAGTISIALRVTNTVNRDMISGRETIVTGIGGELRVRTATGACPRLRHMGKRVRVTADRTDLPEAPRADFHTTPPVTSVSAGFNTLTFHDESSPDEDLVARNWDFGDPASGGANRATGRTVSHTYARPGTYRVTLAIADRYGQVDSVTGTAVINP
jgi:PKD repeat protein